MKKNKIKNVLIVFIILISLVVCFNVGVYAAYSFAATDISYTKSNGSTVSVKAALDELNSKIPTKEIGDEVTLGGEKFYVLEWDNNCDTVNLISKYNLNTAGTAQQNAKSSTTQCGFASTAYWNAFSENEYINLNDYIGFSSTDAIGKAKKYGISKGALASRLLTYQEASTLKEKSSSNEKISKMLWINDNTYGFNGYWLGTAGVAKGTVNNGGVYCISQPYPRSKF